MISVKILGTGCKRCNNLETQVRELIKRNAIEAEVEKVSDIRQMIGYGIIATPGLVINEKVKSTGIIPKDDVILQWLKESKNE